MVRVQEGRSRGVGNRGGMVKLDSGRVGVRKGDKEGRGRGVGSRGKMVKLDSGRVGVRKETRKGGVEGWRVGVK